MIGLVEDTYVRWLASSPLERLAVEPTGTEQWCEGKWQRVNAKGFIDATSINAYRTACRYGVTKICKGLRKDVIPLVQAFSAWWFCGGTRCAEALTEPK